MELEFELQLLSVTAAQDLGDGRGVDRRQLWVLIWTKIVHSLTHSHPDSVTWFSTTKLWSLGVNTDLEWRVSWGGTVKSGLWGGGKKC